MMARRAIKISLLSLDFTFGIRCKTKVLCIFSESSNSSHIWFNLLASSQRQNAGSQIKLISSFGPVCKTTPSPQLQSPGLLQDSLSCALDTLPSSHSFFLVLFLPFILHLCPLHSSLNHSPSSSPSVISMLDGLAHVQQRVVQIGFSPDPVLYCLIS